MPLRQTHTFVVLELSEAAYSEIRLKLHRAGYYHVFIQEENRAVIDMHGIAVAEEIPQRKEPKTKNKK